ncbi:MAG: CpaF family protein [Symbiopectobacterium sp.]|uniref:CpaF family protein n=1 Tax=Symbiopectobacterium sp. TaxID=2952789 RepID=UPI003F3BD3E0
MNIETEMTSTLLYFREQVLKNIDLERIDELKNQCDALLREVNDAIQRVMNNKGQYLSSRVCNCLCELIADEITGYGPLCELMEDESVSDILVNGPERIFVERAGKLELVDKRFISNEQLIDIARRLVARVGRHVDDSQSLVDARMPDGSRLNVVIAPVALDGASISIRKFGSVQRTLANLIEYGSMNEMMENFLVIASRCRVNIIVSGGTGSGKTTLLNAMSHYIDEGERVLTLEDAAELRLQQQHVVRLETRMAGAEKQGQITMRHLVSLMLLNVYKHSLNDTENKDNASHVETILIKSSRLISIASLLDKNVILKMLTVVTLWRRIIFTEKKWNPPGVNECFTHLFFNPECISYYFT